MKRIALTATAMISEQEAIGKVEALLAEMVEKIAIDLAIDPDVTSDEGWCWVFGYNSRAFVQSRASRDRLAGNGPIVVDKRSGAVTGWLRHTRSTSS